MADSKPAAYGHADATPFLPAAERARPHTKLIGLLALGHLVIDVQHGSLPAVLPFLKSTHALTYAQAGTVVLVANLASSLIQPLFGYLSDRTARRWILPASVFVTGAGLGLLGLAPDYATVLALVLVMGLGIAAWHPEGYKTVTGVAGDRKATAMSWFSLGGNVGIALGPPVATALITALSLAGTLGLLVPSVVVGGLLLAALPMLAPAGSAPREAAGSARRGVNMPGAMAMLVLVVTIRSWISLGFTTFVPFYYLDELGAEPRLVGTLLFVFLGSGAVGTLLAGPLADRWGPLNFMRWVFVGAMPFGVLFLLTEGRLAMMMLALFGAFLTSSFTVSVVLGQAYLPRHAGMASGLIIGFAIGAGGLGVAALGWLADRHGVASALWISALLPLAAFLAMRFLPMPRDREALGT
jgi:FSR family fosmidomycin resistance protein-like MFS transporter